MAREKPVSTEPRWNNHIFDNRLFDLPVYVAVRILICVVQALPLATCEKLCRLLAAIAGRVFHNRAALVDKNLSFAFPQMSADQRQRVALQMWEHLFLLMVEVAHTPRKIHETNWRQYVTLVGARKLVASLLSGRPTVLVSGHYGNFELSSYMMGLLGFPSFTIARPLDNVYLDRFLGRFRAGSGQYIFPKDGSGQQIDALVAQGGALALLADQHAGPKGLWVDSFGRPASTHKAIAIFSLGNDAPLIMCYSRRVAGPLEHALGAYAIADPRVDTDLASIATLTEWYTKRLEEIIRMAPEQYWWVHRRWKKRPQPQRGAAADKHAA